MAFAMTGAELAAEKNSFNVGYVFGVVELRLGIDHTDDPARARIDKCVSDANIKAGALYDLTTEHIKRNPSLLALPAFAAVINALAEMCPL